MKTKCHETFSSGPVGGPIKAGPPVTAPPPAGTPPTVPGTITIKTL